MALQAVSDPRLAEFSKPHYLHLNSSRLGHLASLGLPLQNRTVLELGAGPGDHTGFYLDRDCLVASIDARDECLEPLRQRYPQVRTWKRDLNRRDALRGLGHFEVIHCYGLLYHLEYPEILIAAMREACCGFSIIETNLTPGRDESVLYVDEVTDSTQSLTNRGCRPTRAWVFRELRKYFPYVYLTRTQPENPQFPLDWTRSLDDIPIIRSVFVAAVHEMSLPALSPELLDRQHHPG
jgi:hypothetical protein